MESFYSRNLWFWVVVVVFLLCFLWWGVVPWLKHRGDNFFYFFSVQRPQHLQLVSLHGNVNQCLTEVGKRAKEIWPIMITPAKGLIEFTTIPSSKDYFLSNRGLFSSIDSGAGWNEFIPLPFLLSFHTASCYTKDPLWEEMVCGRGGEMSREGGWGCCGFSVGLHWWLNI